VHFRRTWHHHCQWFLLFFPAQGTSVLVVKARNPDRKILQITKTKVNIKTRMSGNAQRDGRLFGEWKVWFLFFINCGQSTSGYVKICKQALQFAMPFSNWQHLVVFRRYLQSSCKAVQNRAKMLMFMGHQNFWGSVPKFEISDLDFILMHKQNFMHLIKRLGFPKDG